MLLPTTRRTTVASVPSGHPYVAHLSPVRGDDGVHRLPDPPVPGAPAGQWWPSPVLEPAWLRAHAADIDVVHVHFGYEHLSPDGLRLLVDTLDELGLPLVLTVHDLQLPHLADPAPHDAALDVLTAAAARVLTLTPGAARRLRTRWGVEALVVPHPHVVPLDRPRPDRSRPTGRVGLQAKPRANNDPGAVRDELAAAVAGRGLGLAPELSTRLDDDALWQHLESLDVLVLAYRWATHSGFVEACADLGTTVVAPRVGHLAEQQPVVGYDLGTPGSLTAALHRALDDGPRRPLPVAERAAQRDDVAAVHRAVYAQVLTEVGAAA